MNKTLSVAEISEPPLLMLCLAVTSLVLNLCFPQYSAYASNEKQRFVYEDSLEKDTIALNNLKKELETRKLAQETIIPQEGFSELKLEPKPAPVKPKIKKPVAAKKPISSVDTTHSKFVTVTAYSSTVDQCDSSPFITASGTRVRDGIIATNLLAFGTKVKFPSMYGDKVFVVEDRMNQRFSNRADIWFETREQAKQFGVRKLEMVIVS